MDAERRGYLRLAAKGLINYEELNEVFAELEETREAAVRELHRLRGQREELERDKDALLESYACMEPEELDRLTPEERHLPDAPLGGLPTARGAHRGTRDLGSPGLYSTGIRLRIHENTNRPALRCSVQIGDKVPKLALARV
ncbi:MAG: hypothetical protein M3151_12345 [Actinomycetota bacterium]|nr:hypothetical protein [Actinomycetota bacterium]